MKYAYLVAIDAVFTPCAHEPQQSAVSSTYRALTVAISAAIDVLPHFGLLFHKPP